jgi:hypothetical protein
MTRTSVRWRILLPFTMVLLASLACGGFQLRPTATPEISRSAADRPVATAEPTSLAATPAASPIPEAAAAPSATPTPNIPTAGLAVGKSARVAAIGGVNVRDKASTGGKQVGKVGTGQSVTLRGGPVQADNFTWWQIDNGAGLTGWVSMGPVEDPWLKVDDGAPPITPAAGGGQLVDRAIKVGDLVQVTTEESRVLTVRDAPGKDGQAVAHSLPGTQFTVKSGPDNRDDLTWWQIEGESINGWAAEGDGTDRWLTPVER